MQGHRRDHHIHAAVSNHAEPGHVIFNQLYVVDALLVTRFTRHLEHILRQVHADEFGPWVEPCDLQQQGCRAAADVQHHVAGLDQRAHLRTVIKVGAGQGLALGGTVGIRRHTLLFFHDQGRFGYALERLLDRYFPEYRAQQSAVHTASSMK